MDKIMKKKPISVYVFGILISILYIIYISTNIYILCSPNFIVTNTYNFYILIPIMLTGLIASIIFVIVKKYEIVTICFSIIILTIGSMMFMNMIGKFQNLELGVNTIPFIIIFVIFGFIKGYRKYFEEYLKKEKNIK